MQEEHYIIWILFFLGIVLYFIDRSLSLTILIFISLGFGQISYEEIKYYDYVIVFFIILMVLNIISRKGKIVLIDKKIMKVIILWYFIILLSFFYSLGKQEIIQSIKSYRLFLWFLFPFSLQYYFKKINEIEKFTNYLLVLAIISSILLIIQSLYFPQNKIIPYSLITKMEDSNINRVYSSAIPLNPILGMYVFVHYIISKNFKYLIFVIITSSAMILTFSRAEIIGYLLGYISIYIIYNYKYLQRKTIYIIYSFIFVFIISIPIIIIESKLVFQIINRFTELITQISNYNNDFLSGRITFFLERWQFVRENGYLALLFGLSRLHFFSDYTFISYGINDYSKIYSFLATESSYLDLILSFGLLGTAIFLLNYYRLIKYSYKKIITYPYSKYIFYYLTAFGFFIYSIPSMLSTNILDKYNGILLIGLSVFYLSLREYKNQ